MTAQPVRIVAYPNSEKRCGRCLEMLPVEKFGTFTQDRSGPALYRCSYCKDCHRKTALASHPRAGRADHRDEARRLRATGLTYREIGERIGVTGNMAWRHSHDVVIARPEPVAEPAVLRIVAEPVRVPVLDEQAASDKRARALAGPSVCVCGGSRRGHVGGRGACEATGCPAWFERGA